MDDPDGQYTYLCSAGTRKSMVLYFTDGTPRRHKRDSSYKPDMVATVKKPGTDESFYGNRIEGALFSCDLRSGRMGGSKTVYWMIDPRWQFKRPEVNQPVGWATTVIGSAGPGNTWGMVPVWASDKWDLGVDSSTREKVFAMYYFQNDYGRSQPCKPSGSFLDIPTGHRPRSRSRSETRYTVVQSWDREIEDGG